MTTNITSRYSLLVRGTCGAALLLMIVALFAPIPIEAAHLLYILFRIGVFIVLIAWLAQAVASRTFFHGAIVIDSLCFVFLLLLWFFAKSSSY